MCIANKWKHHSIHFAQSQKETSTHPFTPDRGLGDGLVEAGLTLGLLLTGLADGLLDVALGLGLALAGLGDRLGDLGLRLALAGLADALAEAGLGLGLPLTKLKGLGLAAVTNRRE
jgi:hypothetical protein